MADTTPPQLETKDLPYVGVPASVPKPDRIGRAPESKEDATTEQEGESTTKTPPKTTRKATESKG